MPKLTTCCNAEIEAVRFGDDALDHCTECGRCVEGLDDTYEVENEHSHITSAPEFRDPLANHRQWQESDPMYRQGRQDAIRELTAQARNVRETHGEQAYIKFITETLFGEPATSDTQRMLRAIDRDSESSGHRDFRRAA